MIEIRRYISDLLSSNMYIIVEDNSAIVIDPCRNISPAKELKIDYIILTHEHYDHISGVNIWKVTTDAPVLCSKSCAENIKDPRKNLSRHFKEFCELQTWIEIDEIPALDHDYSCSADIIFRDKMMIKWHGYEIILFEIPGHSEGSIGIFLDNKYFFSGDSLMKDYEIEVRLPGGSRKKWKEIGSKRIEAICEGTKIWPGHFEDFLLSQSV